MSKDPVVAGLRNRRRRSGPGAKLLRRRPLFLEALEDRRLLACDAIPATTVALPAEPFIGEEVRFSVIFENTGTVPGYGPFVDLVLPRNGTDGAAGTGTPDGLTFISATYLGTPVTSTVFLFPDDDGAGPGTTGTILHPYAVDSSGNPLTVTGTTGDQLVVFQLPFGSFVPAQPEAAIQVSAAMSNLADLNEPLTVQARGGFQFGCDELDNPTAPDPTILTPGSTASDSSTWVDFAATSPVLMRMTKTYNGPENETATGPNYLRTWTLTTSIAAGQTVTDLDIIDGLPNNVVVTNIVFPLADPGTVPATPFGPVNVTYPSELLLGAVPSITGTGGADVVVVIEFYVPEFDANGERVIPINGEDDIGPSPGPPPTINSTSPNLARSVGDWDPIDDRDPAGSGNAVAETPVEDLDDKSIAIQKSAEIVVDVAPTGTPGNPLISPGDVIEYTLDFQISDYYTFGDLVVTDTIRDGQNFDATFAPIFEVRDRLGTVVGAFVLGSNYTYTNNDASDGTEILVFDVSQALIDANPDPDNGDWLYDGILEGGNTRGEPDSAPSAAATGVIRFRTVIQQYYAQNPPSGNPSVVQGDMISNDVIIAGSVRENFEDDTNGIYFEVIYPEERDDSSAGVGMETGSVAKSIYAVNGSQAFSPMNLAPGDLVTYRVQYLMPLSRFEDFRLTDYVPLPVFHVADPNADGVVGPAWSFDLAGSFDAAPPPVGVVQFGPDDTFYNLHAPASNIIPTLTVDAAANSIRFYYGDYADPVIATSTIDLLFTLTVRDAPFADGLFLTNIVRAEKQNSFNDPAIEDELVQIQLGQPVLGITKGVVSTDRVGAVFSPATVGPVGVSFAAPGTLPAFSGTVTSSGLENWPINSNLSGIDAGDLVRFAIAVENTGSSRAGAFDVRIQDTLPAGFAVPSGGLNLSVTDGTGAVIVYNDLGGGLFGTGIELVDPGPTDTTANPPGDNTNAGALDQYSETSGRNILIVTYDLVAVGPPAADSVQPRQTITNTATLFNYASTEGGPDHTVTDLTDDARVTTRDPAVTKTLLGTSVVTPNNSNTQAVIGELITYRVVVTVPEGTINNARVVDTLDLGLRFVSLDSVVASSGDVTSTLAIATPSTAPNDGDSGSQTVTFDLGTITNTNVNNAIAETITLTYTVRVLNTNANQSGIQRNNSARFRWTVDGTANNTPASSAANVRIIEPVLQVDKSVVVAGSGTTGQFGDPVEYTIVIGHAGASDATDAYDVTFSDALPVTYVNVTGFTATHSAGPVDLSGIFEISGGTLQTQAGQSFDLLIGQTVTITVSGTLTLAVQPGQTIDNVATVRWTSLDGAETGSGNVDGERNGSGGVNDYFASDNAIVSILPFAPGKSVISTNQLHTDDLDVAIGEIVTYRIALQVPQGTSSNVTLIDSLDPGLAIVDLPTLADHLTITASSSHVTTSIGDFDTVVANALVSPNGGSLTLDFGNVINDNEDPAEIETIEITYSVVVLNTSTNLRGVGRNNSATINWIAGGVPQSATISAPDVTIVEPELQIIKSNGSPATGEAGDIITFLIVVQHTPDSNADAFDVQLVDVINSLPNKMTYVPSSFANPAGAPPSLYSESGGDLTVTWAQFPLGATSTITFQVTLDITVNPEEILTNTGNLTWTSLPGDITTPQSSNPNSVERTGNPGDPGELNNYAGSDSGIVTILSVDPTKAIVETSEPHTPGSDVAVGEIVRYRLQTSLIEGTTPNLQLVDTLPAGLILLDLDQVLVSFTSDQPMGLAVDLSPPNPDPNNSQVPPTVVLPSSRIGIAGQTITFSLGDVVNNDNDVDIEFVTLEFNVLVTNTAVVNNGQVKTNLFQVFVDGAQFGPTRSVDVTVREPLIANVSKTVLSGAPVDAGDPVTYEVSFSNTGATTAFDVRLLDELDPLWFDSVSVDSITLGGGSLGPIVDDSAGTTVDITVASVPVGGTVVVRYTAILSVNVQPGQTIPNVADVTYTSLPDGGTPLGPDNLTGSITPGGSGAPNGERDGSGGVNDYANSDQADVTLTGQPLFQKLLAGSNQFYTVDPQLTIGEQATYTLVLTIPEGTLPNVLIADIMPAGLVLVAFDSITPSSPAVTTDVAGGFAQILADANAGLFFDDTSFGLDFGTLTNTDTDDLVTETLVITYRAVVLDVMANVSGQTRTNDASFTWDGGTIDDDVTIEIVEPDLTIAKDTNVMVVDGGDTITFTITVDHTASSTAWALDVTVYDTLPAGLTYVGGSVVTVSGPAPTVSVLGQDLAFFWAQFPLGDGPYSFTFDVTVDASITPWTTFLNIADVEWSTLPGDDPDERTYMDSDPADLITSSTTVDDPRKNMIVTSEAHTPNVPDTLVAIGEIVRYRLLAELTEGTFPNLVFVDTLPAGLSFLDAGQVRVSFVSNVPMGLAPDLVGANNNAVPPTFVLPSDRIVTGPGGELRFLLGTVVNNDNDLNAELVVLEFNVLVDNTIANTAGQIRTNEFRVLVDDVPFGDPQSVDVEIVEPRIEDVSKQFVSMAGNQRTFEVSFSNTGTTTAFDALVSDVIPAGASLNAGSIAVTLGGGATGISTAGSTPGLLQVTIGQLPVGGTVVVRYTVTLTATTQTGLLNNVDVTYTSLPGPNGTTTNPTGSSTPGSSGDADGERNGSGADANDYAADANETLGSLGDLVWYDMNANGLVDPGEPGLPNVGVTAVWAGPDGIFGTADDVTLTTTTNASGLYFFNALPPGDYRVTVNTSHTLPLIPTYDLDGVLDSTTVAALGAGENRDDVDFGYTDPSTITGIKFRDDNGNGVRDGLEPPLAGVRVYLDANNNGALDAGERSVITNASGIYTIGGLLPGTYIVRELRPDNTVQTAPGGDGAHTVVIVAPGTTATDINFGNRPVPPQIIDDGDPGFVIQGDWQRARCWIFLQGDAQYLCSETPGTGSNYVEWQFTGLTAGATYRVSTTWYPASGLSQDAPYTVFGGAASVTAEFNQRLSPSIYADSFRDQGVWWADISAAYTLTGTTLVVRLSDDHSGGCLLADAVRIIQQTTPEITVLDGGADLTSGSSVVDLGSTVPGTPLPRTFTVRNDGAAPLILGTITLPDGYSLDTTLGLTTLAPGQTTSFTVQLDAVALGTYSGLITLGNNDNDEAPFTFNIVGVVGSVYNPNPQPAAPSSVLPPAVPLMDVYDGATPLISGLGTIDWGTLLVGDPASRVLTVTNLGTADLLLGTILVPSPGFSASPFGDAVLAPGESTTFTVSLNTSTAGTYAGDLIIYDTSNQVIFTVGLSGVVAAAAQLLPPLVIDNGRDVLGFMASGMTYVTTSGYEKDIHYTRGDNTGDYAEWTFSGLPAGTYLVSTTWVRGTSRASNAPYTLSGVTGGPTTVLVDQKIAPDDLTWNGGAWEHLGTFEITGGSLTVRLTDNANGYVYADAIRVEQVSAASIPVPPPPEPEPEPEPVPPLLAPLVIDNGKDMTDFVASGMTYVTTSGYQKDIHYTRGDNTGDYAQWTFTGLPSGTYLVSTTWVRGTSRASNAPYTLTGVTGGPATVLVDQKLAPDDLTWDGVAWEHLGTFQITGGTLTVRLTDNANGYVYADAVRIEQLSALLGGEFGAVLASALSDQTAERQLTGTSEVSAASVELLTGAAIGRWLAADALAAQVLANVQVRVADLPPGVLGLAAVHSHTIWVDIDADGQGWFIDATPWADEEFMAGVGGQLVGSTLASRAGVDLLTVLAHELGHLLGHEDDYDDSESSVMDYALPPGVRRLPLPVVEVRSGATAGEGENQVVEVLWAPTDNVRGLTNRDDRTSAGTRADAGLTALLAEKPAAWLAADEDLARLPVAARKQADAAQQRLDDVLSSVGDWLDPLDDILSFAKPGR